MLNQSQNIIFAEKRVGETPLECLLRYRNNRGIPDTVPMTYAGRLDPLASGILPILIGDAVHQKSAYQALDKEYQVHALVGPETDTYDILGIPTMLMNDYDNNILTKESVEHSLKNFIGTFEQWYPPYSSKPVQGKPLWQWAREGKLMDISRPSHHVTVYDISKVDLYTLSSGEVKNYLDEVLGKLSGDFRQHDIRSGWGEALDTFDDFQVLSFSIHCGTGMYVRQLVHDLGERIGIPLTVYKLARLKIKRM